MAKRERLKLPYDFLGTLKILANTPPPPERERAKAVKRRKRRAVKKR